MVKVSWSTAEDALITQVLREQKIMGCQAESGWKKQAWVAIKNSRRSTLKWTRQLAKLRIITEMYIVSKLYFDWN
jgi:hypothetical protein